jgi:hypothetical protein
MEVLKLLLKRGTPLKNKMLHLDLEASRMNTFSFEGGEK